MDQLTGGNMWGNFVPQSKPPTYLITKRLLYCLLSCGGLFIGGGIYTR